jgi:xanthine dehydrogenase molybdopterin-binding subunit B
MISIAGQVQSVFFMESIMEHVATALNKTPEEIKEKNLYENGQVLCYK